MYDLFLHILPLLDGNGRSGRFRGRGRGEGVRLAGVAVELGSMKSSIFMSSGLISTGAGLVFSRS